MEEGRVGTAHHHFCGWVFLPAGSLRYGPLFPSPRPSPRGRGRI